MFFFLSLMPKLAALRWNLFFTKKISNLSSLNRLETSFASFKRKGSVQRFNPPIFDKKSGVDFPPLSQKTSSCFSNISFGYTMTLLIVVLNCASVVFLWSQHEDDVLGADIPSLFSSVGCCYRIPAIQIREVVDVRFVCAFGFVSHTSSWPSAWAHWATFSFASMTFEMPETPTNSKGWWTSAVIPTKP